MLTSLLLIAIPIDSHHRHHCHHCDRHTPVPFVIIVVFSGGGVMYETALENNIS